MKKYIIRSIHRQPDEGYFVAFHSFTAFYAGRDKAKKFDTAEEARAYANEELFTSEDAYTIEEVEAV